MTYDIARAIPSVVIKFRWVSSMDVAVSSLILVHTLTTSLPSADQQLDSFKHFG